MEGRTIQKLLLVVNRTNSELKAGPLLVSSGLDDGTRHGSHRIGSIDRRRVPLRTRPRRENKREEQTTRAEHEGGKSNTAGVARSERGRPGRRTAGVSPAGTKPLSDEEGLKSLPKWAPKL
jgi:hypothetical protein